jgi:soluble lytic murein transglycosylase-like protein
MIGRQDLNVALAMAIGLAVIGGGRGVAEPLSAPLPPALEKTDQKPSAAPAAPDSAPAKPAEPAGGTGQSLCLMIEAAAQANGLPLGFFARVIWQESRFKADAVGPPTRHGGRAQGIAQFMPATADERGLLDPFDPVQALPKAAAFLRELRTAFGNLGLAAAAYNAGPQRVRDWLAGSGRLPGETRHYVAATTGVTADDWAAAGAKDVAEADHAAGCDQLMALLRSAPNAYFAALEQRVATGAAKAWGVQFSAGFSRVRALAAFARVEKRFGRLLSGEDPTILAATFRSRGTRAFYQVRIGADTRAAANDLCVRVRRAGGACLVLRNPRRRG